MLIALLSLASPIPPSVAQPRLGLRQWFAELVSAPRSRVQSRVGEATAWLHSRRLSTFPTIDPSDPVAALSSARAMLCTDEYRSHISSLDILVQSALPGAKPLSPALDEGWGCLCSDFQMTSEYTDLATAFVGAMAEGDGEAKAQRVVAAVRALIPVVMGDKGFCSSGCKSFAIALGDWAIGSFSWSIISDDLAFLPAISQLGGLPAAAMGCACAGFSWRGFADLISADLISADGLGEMMGASNASIDSLGSLGSLGSFNLDQAMEDAFAALSGSVLPVTATTTAITSVLKFPAFLFGREGVCAGGCSTAFKLVTGYTKSVAVALLNQEASLAPVSTAVQALSADEVHTCSCGGTLDWDSLALGVSSSLEPLGGAGLTNLLEAPGIQQLPGQILGVVFGPAFLCSSPTCKSMVSKLMVIASTVVAAFGSDDDAEAGYNGLTGVAWCPAEAAAAGYTLRQTFELVASTEPFDAAAQDAFKEKLVAAYNEGNTGVLILTKSAVSLLVVSRDRRRLASGTDVVVTVTVSQPALVTQVQATMAGLAGKPPAELSTMLGVEVVAPPTASEKAAVAASKSEPEGGGGGGGDTMLIVAIASAAGAGALLLALVITCAVCACRKGTPVCCCSEPAAKSDPPASSVNWKVATLQGNTPL